MSENLGQKTEQKIPENIIGVTPQEVTELAPVIWDTVMPGIRGGRKVNEESEVIDQEGRKCEFLDRVTSFPLPRTRIELSPEEISRVGDNPTLELISLPTVGCHHVLTEGVGCPACMYGINAAFNMDNEELESFRDKYFSNEKMKRFVDEAFELAEEKNEGYDFKVYNINALGSFHDSLEISSEVRKYIYEKLRQASEASKAQGGKALFCCESRFEYITEDKMREMRELCGPDLFIEVGVGIESVSAQIREGIMNKRVTPDWLEKLKMMKKHGVEVAGHFMLKQPFETEREAINDVVASIRYMEKTEPCEKYIFMVMNAKETTVVDVLEKEGMYELPNVWSIVEVMRQLGPDIMKKTKIAGFRSGATQMKVANQGEDMDSITLEVGKLVENYDGSDEMYQKIMEMAQKAADTPEATGYSEWQMKIHEKRVGSLAERMANGFNFLLERMGLSYEEVKGIYKEAETEVPETDSEDANARLNKIKSLAKQRIKARVAEKGGE